MDEQEHSATPEPPERPEAPTSPQPAAATPATAGTVKKALTSRGAGWVVATAMTGAVVALAVVLATESPSVVVQPVGAAGSFTIGPAFGGPACMQVPAKALTPAQIKRQGPVTSWVVVPNEVFIPGGVVHARVRNGAISSSLIGPGCMRVFPRFIPVPAPAGSRQSASPSASPSAS